MYKLTKTKPNPRILLHLFTAAGINGLLYLISKRIPINEWYVFVTLALVLIGIGIYFGILFLIGEFTKQDLKFFRLTLSTKKMAGYIRSEI